MKKRKSGSKEGKGAVSPSQLIDVRIKELGDWRGETLAQVRILIKQADPEVVEEWKWREVPVWSHAGIIRTGETYKNVVKMTFAMHTRCMTLPRYGVTAWDVFGLPAGPEMPLRQIDEDLPVGRVGGGTAPTHEPHH